MVWGKQSWEIWRGETDHQHQLLRMRRKRPRRRAAEQRDELADGRNEMIRAAT
jgi:hypothetical protein